jgi:hypothetical protein
MQFEYKIDTLVQAFPELGLRKFYVAENSGNASPVYNNVPVINLKKRAPQSVLGTPIIMPIEFRPLSYQVLDYLDDQAQTKNVTIDAWTLPSVTLISFSRSKRIIKTNVAGRDGSVKEYINNDDWQIKISGLMINEKSPLEYPAQDVERFLSFCNAPAAIRILNDMAYLLGVNDMVIEDFDLPELEGHGGVQPFVINAVSDTVYEAYERNALPSIIE